MRIMHSTGCWHRRIEVKKILMGCGVVKSKEIAYYVDFEAAKRYRNKDGTHISYKGRREVKTSPP